MIAVTSAPLTPGGGGPKLTNEQVDAMNSTLEKGETAFAKVVAENKREFYMFEDEFEIGREIKMQGPRYFCLAESNTISKNHAKIFWKDDQFFIVNLSKNKVSIHTSESSLDLCEFSRVNAEQRSLSHREYVPYNDLKTETLLLATALSCLITLDSPC